MQSKKQKKFIKDARLEYYKIGSISCPAFDCEHVYFGREGFNHLIWKGKIMRPPKEQNDRILMIPYAVTILSKNVKFSGYRKYIRPLHQKNITSTAHFWSIINEFGGIKIKVIVRQINNERKHFFSVMNV